MRRFCGRKWAFTPSNSHCWHRTFLWNGRKYDHRVGIERASAHQTPMPGNNHVVQSACQHQLGPLGPLGHGAMPRRRSWWCRVLRPGLRTAGTTACFWVPLELPGDTNLAQATQPVWGGLDWEMIESLTSQDVNVRPHRLVLGSEWEMGGSTWNLASDRNALDTALLGTCFDLFISRWPHQTLHDRHKLGISRL